MDDLMIKIIELLIIITITAFMRYGIPMIKQVIENSKLSGVIKWVNVAVEAAEQTIKESSAGQEKKAVVTKFLKEMLAAKHISISDEQLNNLIEAAVFAMNNNK